MSEETKVWVVTEHLKKDDPEYMKAYQINAKVRSLLRDGEKPFETKEEAVQYVKETAKGCWCLKTQDGKEVWGYENFQPLEECFWDSFETYGFTWNMTDSDIKEQVNTLREEMLAEKVYPIGDMLRYFTNQIRSIPEGCMCKKCEIILPLDECDEIEMFSEKSECFAVDDYVVIGTFTCDDCVEEEIVEDDDLE